MRLLVAVSLAVLVGPYSFASTAKTMVGDFRLLDHNGISRELYRSANLTGPCR